MPAKKKPPTKKQSKVKNSAPHPGKLLVVGFVALFAIIGATYVFASKAAGMDVAVVSADYEFKVLEDKDGNGKPSYGDVIQSRFYNIKYNVKGNPANYKFNTTSDITCLEESSKDYLDTWSTGVSVNYTSTPGNTFTDIKNIVDFSSYNKYVKTPTSYYPVKTSLLDKTTNTICGVGLRVFSGKYDITQYPAPSTNSSWDQPSIYKFVLYPRGS